MLLSLVVAAAVADETRIDLSGSVVDDGIDHVLVPFEVPAGVVEVQVIHTTLTGEGTILDWGLFDPERFRGYGGGNPEDAIVGAQAASRSYLAGPIPAGTWHVEIGKAKLPTGAADYRLEVVLRTTQTLAPQRARTPYVPAAPLSEGARWLAADLHVHSRESGDASPSLDDIATYAASIGVDVIVLSEHNTTSQLDWIVHAQSHHPSVLLLPGNEITTYNGHAGALGARARYEHRLTLPGTAIADTIAAVHADGALFTIHHPTWAPGDLCIGCAWEHDIDPASIDGVEVAATRWGAAGGLQWEAGLAFWEDLWDRGGRPAMLGGSDDHNGGAGEGAFNTPIGNPTTRVYAANLSESAFLDGIRDGRTAIQWDGPDGPLVTLDADAPIVRAEITAPAVTLRAHVTRGDGLTLHWIQDGRRVDTVPVSGDDVVVTRDLVAGDDPTRWRAELRDATRPRSATSYVLLAAAADTDTAADDGAGCACTTRPGPAVGWLGALAALWGFRRRYRTSTVAHTGM